MTRPPPILPDDDNPFSPPRADLRPAPRGESPMGSVAASAWKAGDQFVMGRAADLSTHCARCGRPASSRLRLELIAEGKRMLWVGLCSRHRRNRSIVRRLLAPTLLSFVFGAGWFVVIALKTMSLPWTLGIGSMAFVLLVLLLLVGERPLVTVEGIEAATSPGPFVRLGGLHPRVLEGLEEWPGPARPAG
ncbi:hypothetical protein [Tautonia sociabilis]|uniref:Uncharacterized protein n=1 Tax=Tautonia sociabilis TaxID=2080755 RepID=A0A432MKL4_9BACT|nr:hypothetical protein [Tautonia sociabilis]RUL87676.1 hypothetical protein TsocGM_10830 [Tautonia sociabilis]